MRLILSEWFFFGKMWKNMEKRPFFRADMAGLGSIGIMCDFVSSRTHPHYNCSENAYFWFCLQRT